LRINTDLGAGAVPVVTVQATVDGQPAAEDPPAAPQAALAPSAATAANP